mmetsp:Transcript_2779/g.5063  ORF Transcript_2779/g.5063 Transcript_2779/m.5063 type:complete len:84 (-) Transcript_2779:140-391(-)
MKKLLLSNSNSMHLSSSRKRLLFFHDPYDNMNFEPNTLFYHKYTAAAQFGSFGLYCESSGPGMLKKDDPEMRQLYLDLAMLVC